MTDNRFVPPQAEKKDKALAVVRAAIGSIPYVGNAAIELIPLLFTAPLERRRQEWMNAVADALTELEKDRGIRLEQLQSNEAFISVLVQATQAAIRNHQKAKIRALRNAVTNSAVGAAIEEDLQLLFIRFVDELTPSHFSLLQFFREHEHDFETLESYEQLFQSFSPNPKSVTITRDEFRLFCEELQSRNLLRISANVEDFSGVGSNNYIVTEGSNPGPMLLVTELGEKILNFVADASKADDEVSGFSSTDRRHSPI